MNNVRQLQPVLVLSRPDHPSEDSPPSAEAILAHARGLRARAVVVISCHWGLPNIRGDVREAAAETVALAKRAGQLFESSGLPMEFARSAHPDEGLTGLICAAADRSLPMIHVSLPAHFGADLMILAGAALGKLSPGRILFVSLCGRVDSTMRDLIETQDLEAMKRYAYQLPKSRVTGIYPLFFLIGLSSGVIEGMLDCQLSGFSDAMRSESFFPTERVPEVQLSGMTDRKRVRRSL
jgi:aromatic ring-opening dioxygenase catalytic subunit (LigB family)